MGGGKHPAFLIQPHRAACLIALLYTRSSSDPVSILPRYGTTEGALGQCLEGGGERPNRIRRPHEHGLQRHVGSLRSQARGCRMPSRRRELKLSGAGDRRQAGRRGPCSSRAAQIAQDEQACMSSMIGGTGEKPVPRRRHGGVVCVRAGGRRRRHRPSMARAARSRREVATARRVCLCARDAGRRAVLGWRWMMEERRASGEQRHRWFLRNSFGSRRNQPKRTARSSPPLNTSSCRPLDTGLPASMSLFAHA